MYPRCGNRWIEAYSERHENDTLRISVDGHELQTQIDLCINSGHTQNE